MSDQNDRRPDDGERRYRMVKAGLELMRTVLTIVIVLSSRHVL